MLTGYLKYWSFSDIKFLNCGEAIFYNLCCVCVCVCDYAENYIKLVSIYMSPVSKVCF